MKKITLALLVITVISAVASGVSMNAFASVATYETSISFNEANQGQQEIFRATNAYRQSNDMAKLQWSNGLTATAQSYAKYMAENLQSLEHSPKGDIFGNWKDAGENIAVFYGKVDGNRFVKAWIQSKDHKENLDFHFTHIGVGFYTDAKGWTWGVQIFANYPNGIGSDVASVIYTNKGFTKVVTQVAAAGGSSNKATVTRKAARTKQVVITAKYGTKMYSQASLKATVIKKVSKNMQATYLGSVGKFYKVSMNGKIGFVYKTSAKIK
ncbi:CAP domain-containing protein [Guggenheimella bovis]